MVAWARFLCWEVTQADVSALGCVSALALREFWCANDHEWEEVEWSSGFGEEVERSECELSAGTANVASVNWPSGLLRGGSQNLWSLRHGMEISTCDGRNCGIVLHVYASVIVVRVSVSWEVVRVNVSWEAEKCF
jgi:hypothetical protein